MFRQICEFLNRDAFEWYVAEYNGNHYIKTLSSWQHLLIMILGQLWQCRSLRVLVNVLNSQSSKLYQLGIGLHVSRSTLSDANNRRDYRIFEEMAETDSVKSYLQRLLHTDGAQNSQALINAMHEMQFVGMKAEFDHARPLAEELYSGDSLVKEYVDYLTLLANDAASAHDMRASNNYLRRALAVSDSISR